MAKFNNAERIYIEARIKNIITDKRVKFTDELNTQYVNFKITTYGAIAETEAYADTINKIYQAGEYSVKLVDSKLVIDIPALAAEKAEIKAKFKAQEQFFSKLQQDTMDKLMFLNIKEDVLQIITDIETM